MKTEIIPVGDPDALLRAVEILKEGGLVAFPTDTVYGIGSMAFNQAAIESIYFAKNRPIEKGIPILMASVDDLDKVAKVVSPLVRRLAYRFWPGPLTLVLPKKENLPTAVSATPTVGVRVPDHEIARALFCMAGPMAVTSANLSEHENSCTAEEVLRQLNGRIPLILDGGNILGGGIPSTVVDVSETELTLLREGPITLRQIKAILSSG